MPSPLHFVVYLYQGTVMRKIQQYIIVATIVLATLLQFFVASTSFAQTNTLNQAQQAQQAIANNKRLKAIPGPDQSVQVGRRVLFDGSASTNSTDSDLQYTWDFGDGSSALGVDVTHIYNQPGRYSVTLTIDNGTDQNTAEVTVTVFEDLFILLSDGSVAKDRIQQYVIDAGRQGVLLDVVEYSTSEPDYVTEEKLSSLFLEKKDEVVKAEGIINATNGSTGLNVLSKFAQQHKEASDISFAEKSVITLQKPTASLARIAQSTFNILRPEYILITDDSALQTVWKNKTASNILSAIQAQNSSNYRIIGSYSQRSVSDFRIWNFMSILVDYMINQGVPVNTVLLILLLPIVATIFAFARQVIGIKAFGIYTPSIITLAFLAIGLPYGLLIFLVVLLAGSGTRYVLKRLHLLFLPRMAIVLTAVTLAVIALLALAARFDQQALIVASIFPILVIIALVEKFVTAQIEKGVWDATRLSIETLILSIVAYFIASWDILRDIVLAYPEIILLTLVINIILGKWTGLRLSEYARFREVRKYLKE